MKVGCSCPSPRPPLLSPAVPPSGKQGGRTHTAQRECSQPYLEPQLSFSFRYRTLGQHSSSVGWGLLVALYLGLQGVPGSCISGGGLPRSLECSPPVGRPASPTHCGFWVAPYLLHIERLPSGDPRRSVSWEQNPSKGILLPPPTPGSPEFIECLPAIYGEGCHVLTPRASSPPSATGPPLAPPKNGQEENFRGVLLLPPASRPRATLPPPPRSPGWAGKGRRPALGALWVSPYFREAGERRGPWSPRVLPASGSAPLRGRALPPLPGAGRGPPAFGIPPERGGPEAAARRAGGRRREAESGVRSGARGRAERSGGGSEALAAPARSASAWPRDIPGMLNAGHYALLNRLRAAERLV